MADVLIGTIAGLPLEQVQALSSAPLVSDEVDPCDMLLSLRGEVPETNGTHAHFVKWTLPNPAAMELGVLQDKLARRPAGLYRVKGFVPGPDGMFAVQVVGQSIDITPSDATAPAMVGIGPEGQVTLDDIATWWAEP